MIEIGQLLVKSSIILVNDKNMSIGSNNNQPTKRSQSAASSENQQIPQTRTKTRSGRVVRTPLRFKNTDSPGVCHVKEGEVVRPSQESTREGVAREPERDHAVVLKCEQGHY